MRYKKRHGGNTGQGYYTCWQNEKDNGCIYCGSLATTREHCPSKAFLEEPFNDLPTIPACFECNNSFSKDELYVACFIDVLKSTVYSNINISSQTSERLKDNAKLQSTIQSEIFVKDSLVKYNVDDARFVRILSKLAICHAGFELDYVNFDSLPDVFYNFDFNLTEKEIVSFNYVPQIFCATEVGSREGSTPLILENLITGEVSAFAFWNLVQDERYRYQVFVNQQDNIVVKMVIKEFLYCEAIFKP